MKKAIKSSAVLLLTLGILFCAPIAAKTWSAHGAMPALATALLVIVSVFIGPLSFMAAEAFEKVFFNSGSVTTGTEILVISIIGSVLLIAWTRAITRRSGHSIPYLPVTGWALMGAYFCVSLVFAHTT